ncbi:type II toxin-antitoxin system PemK/MazF family toxin [Jatrophihabitans sp. YIM 134969]
MASWQRVVNQAVRLAVRTGLRAGRQRWEQQRRVEQQPRQEQRAPQAESRAQVSVRRPPREATGPLRFDYAPRRDGRPDPGEVVWAWVPYEEADGRGKDRPVLVVSRDGADLLALMLTSKDHDRDAADEAAHGRHWLDVGSGGWDPRGRPSEVRLDRVLRLAPSDVRREGAALDRARFDAVAAAVSRLHG